MYSKYGGGNNNDIGWRRALRRGRNGGIHIRWPGRPGLRQATYTMMAALPRGPYQHADCAVVALGCYWWGPPGLSSGHRVLGGRGLRAAPGGG